MTAHGDNPWHNGRVCPLDAKHFCELLEVLRASFADTEARVAQPRHAEVGESLVEKGDSELRGQKREVLDNGQPHAPLLVLCELDNGRKE